MVRTLCDGMAKEFGEGRNYIEIQERYDDAYRTLTGNPLSLATVAKACHRPENSKRIEEYDRELINSVARIVLTEGKSIAEAARQLHVSSTTAQSKLKEYKAALGTEPEKKEEKKNATMEDIRNFRNTSQVGDAFMALIKKEHYDAEMRMIRTAKEIEVIITARYTFVADTNIGTISWKELYLAREEYNKAHKEGEGNV